MKLMQFSMVVMFSLCLSLSVATASGDLSVSGTTTTKNLTITNLDCTTMENGGALTADAAGVVSCSDDNDSDGSTSLDTAYDAGGAGTGRVITADSGAVSIQGADGLDLEVGSLSQAPGDPFSVGNLPFSGGATYVSVSGRYAYVLGTDLHVVDVTDPSNPVEVGSMDPCPSPCMPTGLFVSGRYAYTLDKELHELIVIDVSDPGNPVEAGSVVVGAGPESVFVSGHYAYVIDTISDNLKIIDVTDPVAPSVVSTLAIGGLPRAIYVSGIYAYVVDSSSDDLKIIDVSDPGFPVLVNSFSLGAVAVWSIYVSGSYAYVVESSSDVLLAIDISDPLTPGIVDSLNIGGGPSSVFVSGRYAYVVDILSDDLKVIDASDPTNLVEVGSVSLDGAMASSFSPTVFVSGRYAYVADSQSAELEIIDISGAEFTSVVAHSLEAGNLQIRNDVIANGHLQVTGGVNVGSGGILTDGNVGVAGMIAITNDVVPTATINNGVQLYSANDKGGTSRLWLRDEGGISTVISPHNFSLVGEPSEPLAWSFYSESDTGTINVDMLRTVRLVEAISGQKLVHTELRGSDSGGYMHPGLPSVESLQLKIESYQKLVTPLIQAVQELKGENERLTRRVEALEKTPD